MCIDSYWHTTCVMKMLYLPISTPENTPCPAGQDFQHGQPKTTTHPWPQALNSYELQGVPQARSCAGCLQCLLWILSQWLMQSWYIIAHGESLTPVLKRTRNINQHVSKPPGKRQQQSPDKRGLTSVHKTPVPHLCASHRLTSLEAACFPLLQKTRNSQNLILCHILTLTAVLGSQWSNVCSNVCS